MSDGTNFPWTGLTGPAGSLADARLQVHLAVQVIASAGAAHVEARPDDSHRNLEWLTDEGMLAGNPAGSDEDFRLALRPDTLELHLLAVGRGSVGSKSLVGATVQDGYRWAEESISAFTNDPVVQLVPPEYELPGHPVAAGAPFQVDPSELHLVQAWYANADAALRSLSEAIPDTAPVRCWPHHFDIATLAKLEKGAGENQRTVGIGMTPGDDTYPEPYWYVSPWPYPAVDGLPHLEVGHWHTDGWVGAILTAGELLETTSAAAQRDTVMGFLSAAFEASRNILAN